MKKKITIVLVAVAALPLAAADCGSGVQSWLHDIGPRIQKFADETCQKRGGTANVMLATDRFDDGMVTCKDGTNHLFDL